ncbi:MAG: helix-turn-helix domain-containing protein [Bacteroidales bacterium]|nr:helix-turn-helix domain-containing protein [Bacteroidales bacterium]
MENSNKLLTMRQAYAQLGISSNTFSNLLKTGRIGYIQVNGRKKIPQSELDRFIKESLFYYEPQKTVSAEDMQYLSTSTNVPEYSCRTQTGSLITDEYFNELIKEHKNG